MQDLRKIVLAIQRSTNWLRSMLVVPDGSMGVYERFRIDQQRVNHWVRPDCTMEVAQVFMAYGQHTGDDQFVELARHMVSYVVSLQRSTGWFEGSFPFYRFVPRSTDEIDSGGPEEEEVTFPNDNGKIAERLLWFYQLTADEHTRMAAKRLMDYLMRTQAADGTFSVNDDGEQAVLKGIDFVAWPTMALMEGARLLNNTEQKIAALKGLAWISTQLTPDGRVRTSFETARTEAWRPPSSELAVAVKAYALLARYNQDHSVWNGFGVVSNTLLALQDRSGAIRDSGESWKGASLQNDPDLTDMVYTNGYGLLALQEAYRANGDMRYKDAAQRLAEFLVEVQCWGESGQWDGSWRGSYSLKRATWHGRANQHNELDEGGMYSAYTGWSTAPITYGLLNLVKSNK